MYKENLALNNLQWLICHKTQPNQNPIYLICMYKEDLALNNLQWSICHKPNKRSQTERRVPFMKKKRKEGLDTFNFTRFSKFWCPFRECFFFFSQTQTKEITVSSWLKCWTASFNFSRTNSDQFWPNTIGKA